MPDVPQQNPARADVGDGLSDHDRRRGLLFVGLAVAGVGFAFAVLLGLDSNFTGEVMGIQGEQRGALEAMRETCGIVALGILALLAGLAEPLVAASMLSVFAVGLAAYCWVPDFTWLLIASLVWSQGAHVWFPLPNSMTLSLAEPGRAGRRLGQVHAAGAVGAGLGLGVVILLRYLGVAIRPLFVVAGAAGLLAAAACLGIPRRIKTPGPRMVFRRRYWRYYALCLLEGWRKQIFVAFAGFYLVTVFEAPLRDILWLWVAIHVIRWIVSPWAGRLIDRVGERKVLAFYFLCLTFFFTGYAFIGDRRALYVLYVVDSAFFVFAMGITTYVNRIAPKREHTPTLSMGVAMNHVGAVIMPLVGGLLWKYHGPKWAFLVGTAAALVSVPVALCLPKHTPVNA